jgi:hypothetical protein
MKRPARFSFVALILLLASAVTAAAQVTVFDGTFSRAKGTPVTVHASFAAAGSRATITLLNGGPDESPGLRVSDATIRLNGRVVFGEMQFNQQVARLEAEVELLPVNDLEVFLEGKPGASVAIRVVWPGQQDVDLIHNVWDRLAALYETSLPSASALTAWFAADVAPDFVMSGRHRADELAAWLAGEGGPGPGITFSSVVTAPLDVAGTPYANGYLIRLDYQMGGFSGSLTTYMVFDGSRWLWYGDQQWVETELMSIMSMVSPFNGPRYYTTGLGITLWDGPDCPAYRAGVRSAIVTGPGLPAAGIRLYHMYPLEFLRLYPNYTGNPMGSWFVPLPDAAIAGIPDDAAYTIRLYAEPADIVTLANTPLTRYVKTNRKRPLLSTEMNASVFPGLVVPNSHDQSALAVGGQVVVQWTNVPALTVGYVSVNVSWNGEDWVTIGTPPAPGATLAILDTSAYPRPPWHGGEVNVSAYDVFGRVYGVRWIVDWW